MLVPIPPKVSKSLSNCIVTHAWGYHHWQWDPCWFQQSLIHSNIPSEGMLSRPTLGTIYLSLDSHQVVYLKANTSEGWVKVEENEKGNKKKTIQGFIINSIYLDLLRKRTKFLSEISTLATIQDTFIIHSLPYSISWSLTRWNINILMFLGLHLCLLSQIPPES